MIPEALHLGSAAVYGLILIYLTLVIKRSGKSFVSRFSITSSAGVITLGAHHLVESSFNDPTMHATSEILEASAFGILALAVVQLYAFAKRISSN